MPAQNGSISVLRPHRRPIQPPRSTHLLLADAKQPQQLRLPLKGVESEVSAGRHQPIQARLDFATNADPVLTQLL
jgi:hypothetical protein